MATAVSTARALLEALVGVGITHLFANWGSDHPGLIEAIADARANARALPAIVTAPNEMVALSAAHGFAQVSGRPAAVLVHVDCGTQALAGALHNADKGRVPVLILAGASPFTQEGELAGSRNEFIQWIQDVHDQRGIVRGYTRYDAEVRSGENIGQMVRRALTFALSDPKGPAYLMIAREVLEAPVTQRRAPPPPLPVAAGALGSAAARQIAAALAAAERPLLVTSYMGRDLAAVCAAQRLAERIGMGVLESVPNAVNFPAHHPLYQGNQWNQPVQNEALATADVILLVDSDVPWIPGVSRPADDARIFQIDVDPLKRQMPLWDAPLERAYAATASVALAEIDRAAARLKVDAVRREARQDHWRALHASRRARLDALEQAAGLTGEITTAAVKRYCGEEALYVSEGISHYHTIGDHLALSRAGGLITSGGGSLGYHGGAAIGAKLAERERLVVALTGDGSYLFSVPSSVHWMARRYETPFLTVIYNNRGWKSPRLSALALHPEGHAARANDIDVAFDPAPDHTAIAAAAGGAFAATVETRDELDCALKAALHAVQRERRAAVVDVVLPHLAGG